MLINDNQEHRWNDSGASISGWTSGSYILSEDSSTLHIKGLNFSASQDGVTGLYSDTPLTIIASGANSIKAVRTGILILQGEDFGSLSVSGDADSSLTITTTVNNGSQVILASSGSFNLIELTAKSQNNDEYGIFYTGDLTIKDSTVNASSLSAGTLKIEGSSVTAARDLYANASTGTSSISQSRVIAYKSANLFNLLEIKDNAAFTGGQIDCSNGLTQSSGLVSTLNGAVILNQGNYDGSGGSLTEQTDIKVAKGDMTLKGTAVRASNGKVYVGRDLKASGGSLTVGKGGIYVGGDLRLSGSGFIETTAEEDNTGVYKPALKTVGKFIVDGGTLRAFQNGSEGNAISVSNEADVNGGTITATVNNSETGYSAVQFDGAVYLQGGRFTAAAGPKSAGITCQSFIQVNENAVLNASGGTGCGVSALDSFTLNSGTVTVTSKSNHSIKAGKLQMRGGKLDMDSGSSTNIVSSSNPASIAGDIWISTPADGTIHFNQDPGYILSSDGAKASKAVLQKVNSISIDTAPDEDLYLGDMFDTDSLVLKVEFADGSVAPLTYKTHTDMITLDPSQYADLSPGDNRIQVSCLTKTTSFTVKVKELGVVDLSGTADIGSHHLNWTESDGATGYEVYGRKKGESNFALITSTSANSFDHNGISPGEAWDYVIEPVRSCQSGAETHGNRSNRIRLEFVPDPPSITLSGSSYDSITLSWEPVTGAFGYYVYRSEDGENDEMISYVTVTAFRDSGLVTGRGYSYFVKSSIPDHEVFSEQSNVVKATPAFSGNTTLRVSNTGRYVLNWSKTSGATGYEVWRGMGASGSRTLLRYLYGL